MKYILDLDMERCSACGACMIACIDQNDIDVTKGEVPFRAVFDVEGRVGSGHKTHYLSMSCMHCADAPCIPACPCGCLYKDENGLTLYDNTACIGCHSCAMACPYGAPTFGADGKMVKCDGCIERMKYGYEPACVRICPTKALHITCEEELAHTRREHSMQKLTQALDDPQ